MELIKIRPGRVGGAAIETVNARELHLFLESKQDFSNWIKGRIDQYGFVENVDFTVDKVVDRRITRIEYHLGLDMAKEISMVERNAKGKEARQYFIECELRAKSDPIAALNDPRTLRGVLLNYSERVLVLETKVAEQAPKVAAFDRIKLADGLVCIRDAAKALGVSERKELVPWLLNNKWCYRRPGTNKLIGYSDKTAAGSGYLDHKCVTAQDMDGVDVERVQVKITAKGMAKLAEVFAQKSLDLEEAA